MNWYKRIKLARGIIHKPNFGYLDIGHKAWYGQKTKNSEKVWAWSPFSGLSVSENVRAGHDRNGMWGNFMGRYEQTEMGTKRVSVSTRGAPIPQELIDDLKAEFGNDITVYTFG